MAKKLKAGVIGLGMGGGHLAGYLTHPDVEVVAIADRREDRRALLPTNHPSFKGKIYHEGAEMIEKEQLDIISVAVPND
ncbi:MAG: Gfo/Idh/MocA family oxidoreductase, partial [Lentisphaeria bacterium]|nr:Gfo/Idh/MocA family oxidoreductase [Lentisphaeria bacterium]